MPGSSGDAPPSIETRASWVIAITAVTMLSVSFGAPLLVVVALPAIAADLDGARSIPALASSLAYLGAGAGGMLMGWLAGRTSTRLVAFVGGAMVGCGLLLAAGGAAWQLVAGFGLLVGFFGNGALYPPMMTYVSLWFDRRRGTALALVSSGQYVAGAIWPMVFERAIAAYGWQRTMLGYGVFAAAVILPLAALVLRPAPRPLAVGGAARDAMAAPPVFGLPPNQALGLLAFASFLCCIPMAMPAAHLVAFCGDLGIAGSHGAAMLSVLLTMAFVARQLWGWVSDRIGGLNTVIAGNICQAVGMAAFLATQDEAGLFFIAAAFGLGFSGIVPAYVLAVRELFPAREAAWRVPALLFLSLSGMAAGAWLAGVLYDAYGYYAIAWQVGIGCNLAALALLGTLALRRRPAAVPA
ncbi:MFS transporter [Paeniroseomonas aquatica]|uniref:MFS transporter n=1 Tax=Paeniroseomonas aquatica TaxID=373043 RepID=A0ABT8A7P3_9PROT|nr:MFS transporter [Paeniroseomonas aquatica]MDN3565837.1 MFS transporter [Paeniroseomonas aquatica]